MSQNEPYVQLQMIWPRHRLHVPPLIELPDAYELRTYQPGYEPGFYGVMATAGFEGWNDERMKPLWAKILPDGWFLIVHRPTHEIVATAMALHNPSSQHPFGGELAWVAANDEHRGQGLGMAVCAAVTSRFLAAGYRNIYLLTDDWRWPALKTYLKLGYVPLTFAPEMQERWRSICAQLEWPFAPGDWPQQRDYHITDGTGQ